MWYRMCWCVRGGVVRPVKQKGVTRVHASAGSGRSRGERLKITVQGTSVPDSNLFPFLDNVEVPVKSAFERVRGVGAASVEVDVLYLDDSMRIMRTSDGQMFVYGRL